MSNYATQYLGKEVRVVVDRPLGTEHPEHKFIYPINYGYVPGTTAPDGEGIDAYIIGVDTPVKEYAGVCVAVIHRRDDDDDKLVVCSPEKKYGDTEILQLVEFQEQWFDSEIIR